MESIGLILKKTFLISNENIDDDIITLLHNLKNKIHLRICLLPIKDLGNFCIVFLLYMLSSKRIFRKT